MTTADAREMAGNRSGAALRIEATGDRNIDAFANYIVVDAFEIQ